MIQQDYLSFLRNEGYMPKAIDTNAIVFKCEGKTFIIHTDAHDTNYLQMVLPNIWEIESEAEKTKALQVANEVNRTVKVAVVTIAGNAVHVNIELFIDDAPILDDFFRRAIAASFGAVEMFSREMTEKPSGFLSRLFTQKN
jgi:hypothetical protein